MPLICLWLDKKRDGKPPVVAGIAVVTAANLMDMVPNSELSPVGLMMVGALAGYVQRGPLKEDDETPETVSKRQVSRYSRFEPKAVRDTAR